MSQAPDLTQVVVAVGSGGTMAGLIDSLGASRVVGVDCGAIADPALTVSEMVSDLSGAPGAPDTLRLRRDQVGDGYSALTGPVMAALLAAARTEGLVLDPIYTGRAMAGLIVAVEEGDVVARQSTVFVHTGGLPGLFGHAASIARAEGQLTA